MALQTLQGSDLCRTLRLEKQNDIGGRIEERDKGNRTQQRARRERTVFDTRTVVMVTCRCRI